MAGEALKRSAMMDAAALCEADWSDGTALNLDDAIALLEAGKASDEMLVNFGDGKEKTVTIGAGLLQRLKGHRMLLAIADGAADIGVARNQDRTIFVDPATVELLEAIPQK